MVFQQVASVLKVLMRHMYKESHRDQGGCAANRQVNKLLPATSKSPTTKTEV